MTKKSPKVLIMCSIGTNREIGMKYAFENADAIVDIVYIDEIVKNKTRYTGYDILAIPGGFSYGDILGAGSIFALKIKNELNDYILNFADKNKPILGICNGFQVLVKCGLLPGIPNFKSTLTVNESRKFECRWVRLEIKESVCLWTKNLSGYLDCPVAHGEGRFIFDENNEQAKQTLIEKLVVFKYVNPMPANSNLASFCNNYPHNPNGSSLNIAGICNLKGNILGLMPHPEDHIYSYQKPCLNRKKEYFLSSGIFSNIMKYI